VDKETFDKKAAWDFTSHPVTVPTKIKKGIKKKKYRKAQCLFRLIAF